MMCPFVALLPLPEQDERLEEILFSSNDNFKLNKGLLLRLMYVCIFTNLVRT